MYYYLYTILAVIILTMVMGVVSLFALWFVMRYYLHMFQLNGYKNNEQKTWLKKNKSKQVLLALGAFLGLAQLIFTYIFTLYWLFYVGVVACVIFILYLAFLILIYSLYKKYNDKKKLVFTARVKRLIATDIILCLIIFFLFYRVGRVLLMPGICMILACLQYKIIIFANIINKPIEKAISNGYVNDAKKRLASMPDLKVIGITGSYGKTSVKYYLNDLLSYKYDVLMTPGNFNTTLGVVRTIREQLKPTHQVFLCEMGARYVNDIKEICDLVHPDAGIITSIGPQHLETFGSMENIVKTKFELADAVSGKGILYLNADNEFIQEKSLEYHDKIFYSQNGSDSGYTASDISVSSLGTDFTVTAPNGSTESFHTRLIGSHNVLNLVGAIAVANSMGISLSELKSPVRRIVAAPHRLEILKRGEVTIIDDAYNSNPVGSKSAVETLKEFDGLRILITPGMIELGEKEKELNYKFGTYAAPCCDYILLVGGAHTEPIKNGALSAGFDEKKLQTFEKLGDAMSFAYGIVSDKHKVILLENDLPDNY